MLESFQRANEESGRDPEAPTCVASSPNLPLSSDNEPSSSQKVDVPTNAWARTMPSGTVTHVAVCVKPRVTVLCQNKKAWKWLSEDPHLCAGWTEARDSGIHACDGCLGSLPKSQIAFLFDNAFSLFSPAYREKDLLQLIGLNDSATA